jgi:hypothetical protein
MLNKQSTYINGVRNQLPLIARDSQYAEIQVRCVRVEYLCVIVRTPVAHSTISICILRQEVVHGDHEHVLVVRYQSA